jgi:hypothetical protein
MSWLWSPSVGSDQLDRPLPKAAIVCGIVGYLAGVAYSVATGGHLGRLAGLFLWGPFGLLVAALLASVVSSGVRLNAREFVYRLAQVPLTALAIVSAANSVVYAVGLIGPVTALLSHDPNYPPYFGWSFELAVLAASFLVFSLSAWLAFRVLPRRRGRPVTT